jgi:hypothetical protein
MPPGTIIYDFRENLRNSHLPTSVTGRRMTVPTSLNSRRPRALAISVPAGETRVLKYFQERMPYGVFVPDVSLPQAWTVTRKYKP